jgi:SAM-dependent methyltransferase
MTETLEQATREGANRLHPSLTNPSWLVLTRRRELLHQFLTGLPPGELTVLDIGGRIQPYRPLLEGRVAYYLAIDLRPNPLVNVLARAEALPLPDNQIDLIICTQVLEYVSEPNAVMSEMYRVLKPGGYLFLSAPSIFPFDSVEDRWRFTRGGIVQLLHRFKHVEVRGEGSSIEGLFRTIALWITLFARPAVVAWSCRWMLVPTLNLSARFLSNIIRSENEQFSVNFSAFARK